MRLRGNDLELYIFANRWLQQKSFLYLTHTLSHYLSLYNKNYYNVTSIVVLPQLYLYIYNFWANYTYSLDRCIGTYLLICPCFQFTPDPYGLVSFSKLAWSGSSDSARPIPIRKDRFPNKLHLTPSHLKQVICRILGTVH